MLEYHVQTKHEVEGLLRAAGARPLKRLGQHFLIDGNLMRKLVAAADLDHRDVVLEVGAGTGGLTDLLVGKVRKVIAVEIDRCLVAILTERFASIGNISIVAGDILAHKHALRREVVEAFSGIDAAAGGGVKLVANLPYQVATPLVMNLLTDHPNVRRLCFTVQAEVADRITACENSKAFGPLSILTQTMCDVIPIVRLPPTAFWPRPAVNSVMLRLDVRTRLPFDRAEVEPFVRFVRGVFGHRRKTLRAALACFVDHAAQERVCRCFDPLRRPETFSVGEWLEVFRVFRTGYGAGG